MSCHVACRQAFGLAGRQVRSVARRLPLPAFIAPQLSQPVEKPASGPQWLHEIKLGGYRMAARIDNGRAHFLTRTGLDWSEKYPNVISALANLKAKTALSMRDFLLRSRALSSKAPELPRRRRQPLPPARLARLKLEAQLDLAESLALTFCARPAA